MTSYMPFKGGIGLLLPPPHGMGMHTWCPRWKP